MELRQKLSSSPKDLPADAAVRLDQIERDAKGLRGELSRLDTRPADQVQTTQVDFDRRLKATEKAVDDLDD